MSTRAAQRPVLVLAMVAACTADPSQVAETSAPITVPTGFTEKILTTSISEPIALDFLPDKTLVVASRKGKIYIVENKNDPAVATAIDLGNKVCSNRERGVLGVAVHPQFADNRRVYIYYTFKKDGAAACPINDDTGTKVVNRVSRFDYDASTKKLSNEQVVLDNILSHNGWHNGGDLKFGPDGLLYVGVGDSGADLDSDSTGWGNRNSRRKSLAQGKVLRVKDNGEPAPGNPWLNSNGARRCTQPGQTPSYPRNDSAPCKETFAWGFRNPYRLNFRPDSGALFVNEVGQNIGGDWEEINLVEAGLDYGWNRNQGPTSDGATRAPLHAYEIGIEVGGVACRCITGGAFVTNGAWPTTYNDSYLFADYTCGVVFRIKQNGGSWTRSTFASGFGGSSLVHLAFGPNPDGGQSLFYLSFNGNKLARIDGPSDGNRAPTARVSASPTSGPTPLAVRFDGSASSDPDAGDRVARYLWNFGDGTSQTTTTPTVSHTYTASANVTATLTVEDSRSPPRSGTASVRLFPGDDPPTVTITGPSASTLFVVGNTYRLTATATDPEDGALPASALSWEVKKVHDEHTHPFLSQDGNNVALVPEGPEDSDAVNTSHLSITVTARDQRGQVATDQLDFFPHVVPVAVQTVPTNLRVKVNGVDQQGAETFDAWEGWQLPLEAPTQVVGGVTYVFDHWSDGGAAAHAARVPATGATYTATFRQGEPTTRIDFTTATATVPVGYLRESGAAFGARGGGLSYGWDRANALTRERNLLADKRYDTTILMEKAGDLYTWELEVPAGVYQVKVVAGDAAHFDGSYHITAEGRAFLDGTPTSANRFVEVSKDVAVSDGRLTLANGAGSVLSRICFVEVTRVGDLPTPLLEAKIDFTTATATVPAGYLREAGAAFGARGGGLSYGWDRTNTLTRERNVQADKRYDTTILMEKDGALYTWELAVPNGTYRLHLVVGDAGFFDGSYHVTAEGQPFLDGTPTSASRFVEVTASVTVTDGRLTLANGAGSWLSRIAFLEIGPP